MATPAGSRPVSGDLDEERRVRKSGEKGHSRSPEKKARRQSAAEDGGPSKSRSPEKRVRRQSAVEDGGPSKSRSPEKRTRRESTAEDGGKSKSRSPEKRIRRESTAEPGQSKSRSPEKRVSRDIAGEDMRRKSKSKSRSPEKKVPVVVEVNRDSAYTDSNTSKNALSVDSLAKLDALNAKHDTSGKERTVEKEKREKDIAAGGIKERRRRDSGAGRKKKRIVSGAILEEGRGRRGGFLSINGDDESLKRRRWCVIGIIFLIILLIILIPVGVLVVGKQNGSGGAGGTNSTSGANSSLAGISESEVPTWAKGSYLDPFTWLDTRDFNLTFTNDTVGGLSIMGLNSTWNDSAQANQYVPPLDQEFKYGQMPIRGINLGGWLSIEPFITPSLFSSYEANLGIVDEYTLCQHLGPTTAQQTIESHYSTFITEQDFADIQAAGFDHVRIPYSYWAVTTYDGDPYVAKTSWRYLLRGIEYARKYGLRVNLDLHALPGSQNGWNHSGRQGEIGWINGTDGSLNANRALEIHNQLSQFFAQPRYANVVGLYGLVNEPRMTLLPIQPVLDWTTSAITTARNNGIKQAIVFGDGFLGLPNWQGKLTGIDNIVMDAHQYVIFNNQQIAFTHQTKLNFACSGWTAQMTQSINTATG
jgi:glucan 1,3-beta-glucosidase